MTDLAKIDSGLSEAEKRQIHRRAALVAVLGKKYALHPENAPAKGTYNRQGVRLG
ncbi:hypothetical protein [Cupriavidus campinensis]